MGFLSSGAALKAAYSLVEEERPSRMLEPIVLPVLIVKSRIPGMLGIHTTREATPSLLRILRRASQ
jgi:hypothetical protein